MQFKFKNIVFIPLLFLIILVIPILSLYNDLWDGVVIEYASISQNMSGLEVFYFDSGWFLQYFFSVLIIYLSDFFTISYKNFNAIITYFIFILFLYENSFIFKRILKLDTELHIWYLLLITTFPAFSVLISSMMTFQFFCFTLTLTGLRLIHSRLNLLKVFIGYLLIIISLNYHSLLVFTPILSWFFDFFKTKKYFFSKTTLVVLLLSFLIYFIRLFFFPPTNLYEDYNKILTINKNNFYIFLNGIYYFSTYPGLIIFLNSLLFIFIFLFGFKIKIDKKNVNKFFFYLLPTTLLFIASIIPYIAVGKWVGFWDLQDWSARYAILLSIPCSILTIILISHFLKLFILRNKLQKVIINIFLLLMVAINISLFSYGVLDKMNRNIFENKLMISLKNNFEQSIIPGYVNIYGANIPSPQMRYYEINYLLYRAFKKPSYFGNISLKINKNIEIPKTLYNDERYKFKYIFDYNMKCSTFINIETENFNTLDDKIKNIFRIQKPKVIIKSITEDC